MANLSPEVFHLILNELDIGDPTLCALRLVSKTVKEITTPVAFSVITVQDSVKSAEAVSFLQTCDSEIRDLVQEVVFQGDAKETSSEDSVTALFAAFSGLSKFPNLRRMRFDFHDCYEEIITDSDGDLWHGDATRFLRLQIALLEALATNPPPPLISLVLNSIIAIANPIYARQDFRAIFSTLQILEISVICDDVPEPYPWDKGPEPRFFNFWDRNKSVSLMMGSAQSLTSLKLRSDEYLGGDLPLSRSFKDIVLPHLSELVLDGFVLDKRYSEDSDIVLFIIQQKNTLIRLALYDCIIDTAPRWAPALPAGIRQCDRPWHAVFQLFETQLPALREFVFVDKESGGCDFRRTHRFPYAELSDWIYYALETERVENNERDMPAYESLMATIETRNLKALEP